MCTTLSCFKLYTKIFECFTIEIYSFRFLVVTNENVNHESRKDTGIKIGKTNSV